MKPFKSFLAQELEEFLLYREKLGYSIKPCRYYLLIFDKYLINTEANRNSITPEFFLNMRANLKMESGSINIIISSVRMFFRYLVRCEYYRENPVKDIPFLKENTIVPFVFSPEQVEQILYAFSKRIRKSKQHFLSDLTIYLHALLLARCGLRISEPLKLLHMHYRKDDATIYIEKTKFKKDRLIPIPKDVITAIKNYFSVRERLLPFNENHRLLAIEPQKPLKANRFRRVFSIVLKDIGLFEPRRVIGSVNFSQPTPHSFRHSFAVNTLIRIKQRKESIQHALPILAAYMGHTNYKHTSVYLKVADAISRKNLVDFSLWQKKEK